MIYFEDDDGKLWFKFSDYERFCVEKQIRKIDTNTLSKYAQKFALDIKSDWLTKWMSENQFRYLHEIMDAQNIHVDYEDVVLTLEWDGDETHNLITRSLEIQQSVKSLGTRIVFVSSKDS